MLKKINSNLRSLEQKKQLRQKKQADLQAELNDIEREIKYYTTLKKQYENLEKKLINKKNSKNQKTSEVQTNE